LLRPEAAGVVTDPVAIEKLVGFAHFDVSRSQLKPDSRFYKAINIGFPNAYDRAHGYEGKYLMIHELMSRHVGVGHAERVDADLHAWLAKYQRAGDKLEDLVNAGIGHRVAADGNAAISASRMPTIARTAMKVNT
jgi:hypothetical protein